MFLMGYDIKKEKEKQFIRRTESIVNQLQCM